MCQQLLPGRIQGNFLFAFAAFLGLVDHLQAFILLNGLKQFKELFIVDFGLVDKNVIEVVSQLLEGLVHLQATEHRNELKLDRLRQAFRVDEDLLTV